MVFKSSIVGDTYISHRDRERIHNCKLSLVHALRKGGQGPNVRRWLEQTVLSFSRQELRMRLECPRDTALGLLEAVLTCAQISLPRRLNAEWSIHTERFCGFRNILHLFICLSVDGHLGCFHFSPVTNNAAVNIRVYCFV